MSSTREIEGRRIFLVMGGGFKGIFAGLGP
jgi:hypothetical protein